MEFLAKLGKKIADFFLQVDTAAELVEKLGWDVVTWEARREALEGEKAAAYAKLLDFRERELDGQPNPKALGEARAAVADVDERLEAVQRKVILLMEELQTAVLAEISVRHETSFQRVEALQAEQRAALPEISRALALAVHLRDRHFRGPSGLPFTLGTVALPQAYDEELAKLQAAEPPGEFLARLDDADYDTRRSAGSEATYNFSVVRVKALLKRLRQEV